MKNNYKPYGSRYMPQRTPVRTACPILREFFRIALEVKRYTIRQIAVALDLSETCIQHWKSGRSMPDMPMYLEFAKFLGVKLAVQPG